MDYTLYFRSLIRLALIFVYGIKHKLTLFFWSEDVSFSSTTVEHVCYCRPSATESRLTLCDPMDRCTPGLPVHHPLPELLTLTSTELLMPSNRLILFCPLLLCPQSFPASVSFSSELTLRIGWPEYCSVSFSINLKVNFL